MKLDSIDQPAYDDEKGRGGRGMIHMGNGGCNREQRTMKHVRVIGKGLPRIADVKRRGDCSNLKLALINLTSGDEYGSVVYDKCYNNEKEA